MEKISIDNVVRISKYEDGILIFLNSEKILGRLNTDESFDNLLGITDRDFNEAFCLSTDGQTAINMKYATINLFEYLYFLNTGDPYLITDCLGGNYKSQAILRLSDEEQETSNNECRVRPF